MVRVLHALDPWGAPSRGRKGLRPVGDLFGNQTAPHLEHEHALVGIAVTIVEICLEHPQVTATGYSPYSSNPPRAA
ncbi:MAG: hypothetical protein WBD99_13900 [Thermodesulfobacteriota bacterium]